MATNGRSDVPDADEVSPEDLAMLVRDSVRELTSDLSRRYRGIALAAVAILLLTVVMPTRVESDDDTSLSPVGNSQAAFASPGVSVPEVVSGEPSAPLPSVQQPAAPVLRASQSSPATSAPAAGPVAPGPSVEPAPSTTAQLSIVASGYTSTTGGTPAEQEPADGGLPVTSGAGYERRTFMRLAGGRSVLVLKEASGTNSAGAEIDVCPVTASWEPSRGGSLDSGPTFDASRCAHGDRQDDGTWHFDLDATGSDADAPNGFAVVRAPSSTAVFDVVFDPSPVG